MEQSLAYVIIYYKKRIRATKINYKMIPVKIPAPNKLS